MGRILSLLVFMFALQVQASECVISSTFPDPSCSFSSPFDASQLKFGNLDSVFNDGESIWIGPARFDLDDDVDIFDASEPDCEYDGDDDELSNLDINQEIAFTVSENNTRVITQLWLLNCTVEIAR